MIEISRLHPLLRIAGYSFLLFCAFNVSLWLVSAAAPRWINVPKQFFGVDFLSDNIERVYGAESAWKRSVALDTELVVIMGLSGASEGVELAPLYQRAGESIRFLSLSGAGRNINEIGLYANPLLNSTLRPGRVIFAISPFHLMDPPDEQAAWSERLAEISIDTLLLGWFADKRTDIRNILDVRLLQLRYELSRRLSSTLVNSTADPWRDSIRLGMPQLTNQLQWDERLREYGARGYYTEKNYREPSDQVNRLVELVSRFRNQGAKVMIVFMPEHSTLRARIPDAALKRIDEQLADSFVDSEPVATLDMRSTVPDSGFKDISHLNERGRAAFSSLLAERLQAPGSSGHIVH